MILKTSEERFCRFYRVRGVMGGGGQMAKGLKCLRVRMREEIKGPCSYSVPR